MSVYPFPNITPNSSSWQLESNTAAWISPFTGATQTLDRSGERWRVRLTFNALTDAERGKMQSFLTKLNGQQHRFWLQDHGYTQRGALTVTELISNSDYSNGLTDWTIAGGGNDIAVSVADQGVRLRRKTLTNRTLYPDNPGTTTTGASYVAVFQDGADIILGADDGFDHRLGSTAGNSDYLLSYTGTNFTGPDNDRSRYHVAAPATSMYIGSAAINGNRAVGNILTQYGMSLSRGLAVDNGYNALKYSQDYSQSDWTKTRSSVTDDQHTAPDGNVTAAKFIEDATASNTHNIQQDYTKSASAEWWTYSAYFKRDTDVRDVQLKLQNSGATGYAFCTFDLGAGTAGSVTVDGTNYDNGYASIHDVGDGWYRCRISCVTDTDTTITAVAFLVNGSTTYTGDGSSYLIMWGHQLQKGRQVGRYTVTTTTAVTGTAQTGRTIWVKGLDSDTDGQLLPGDRVEINGQLCMVTSDLDGDAEGIGLLHVTPGIRSDTSDEDAVLLHKPHGKFILQSASWNNTPGGFSSFTLEAVEDIT